MHILVLKQRKGTENKTEQRTLEPFTFATLSVHLFLFTLKSTAGERIEVTLLCGCYSPELIDSNSRPNPLQLQSSTAFTPLTGRLGSTMMMAVAVMGWWCGSDGGR